MANAFNKEERVAFEQLLEGFNDAEIMAKTVKVYNTDSVKMARANDIIWRPMPYIAQSFDGTDMTSNFKDQTQLSVPATLGYKKSSPWAMDALELRDALQEGRLGDAAKQKLGSDINQAVLSVAVNQGTLVVARSTAAAGFDDVAQCDSIMNEQGVDSFDRVLALNSRDYNAMAKDLANRSNLVGKSVTAYEKALVGPGISGFDVFKLDNGLRLTAAAGGGSLTIDTRVAGAQFYTPKATSTAGTGETANVDNRTQQVTISATTNVAAGDCFTIANVFAVHHITKQSTGQLKTFRVISVDSGTTMTISPPIISAQGGTDAEKQYKNVSVSGSGSATAAITFLNTVTAGVNPFWKKDAIELLPGRYAVPSDAGTAVMRGSTDSGIELVMQKWYDINTMKTKFRVDTLFGVAMVQPEMAGIMLFSQT